jgi:hypothetical protein
MKGIEAEPKELQPEQFEELIQSYNPLRERIEAELESVKGSSGRGPIVHILTHLKLELNENVARMNLNNPDQRDKRIEKMQKTAELLQRFFDFLDENPKMAEELKERGYEAFPFLQSEDKRSAEFMVEELERIAEEKIEGEEVEEN